MADRLRGRRSAGAVIQLLGKSPFHLSNLGQLIFGDFAGLPLSLYLAALLPHGIFELAALVLAAACGVYLCRNIGRLVTNSPKKIPAVELLTDLLRVLVMVIAPLTAAAAFIESYITPVIASFFM